MVSLCQLIFSYLFFGNRGKQDHNYKNKRIVMPDGTSKTSFVLIHIKNFTLL